MQIIFYHTFIFFSLDMKNKAVSDSDSSVVECRLVIEMCLTPGLISKLAMRRCVLGKDTLSLFPIGTRQSTRCCEPT